ncbi:MULTISPECIES: Bug family tripartite tricarboxylate transporter substrate binding protein [Polaromonas]|uniref:Bug family tripartite tricarboxylate transporter substrate binding protein n=1 Tax=Polaromonas aquatica TaxID=332657 RepID=A0ABW1TZU2_9BURK
MSNESTRRTLLRAAAAGSAMSLLFAHSAFAQAYPARSIRLVVPFAPGGSTDVVARLIGQRLSDALKAPVVVENKAGAGSVLGTDLVAKSAPDGYTLVVAANPAIAPGPLMRTGMPYDPISDFTHVVLLGTFPNGFVVRANHPAKTLTEFIALAHSKPGVLNYASAGIGSAGFLTGELLKQATGIDMVHVPYKGSGPAIIDLMGGQLDGLFESLVTATGYIRSGKLRLLAVTGDKRSKTFPDVPAINELVPGVTGGAWFGISAPARLPPEIALRLQLEIQAIVNAADMQARLNELGMAPLPLAGPDYLGFIQGENRKWGPVIKAGNIKVE